MPEKKSKKAILSENAIATITQRYDVATVLTVFQELSHYADENFNWNELVKKTTTGISTAREYQMLWRHLAYGYSFPEDLDQEAQPMDDDSDLDCELESLPSGCAESTSETSACVKVIIASRTLSESTPSSSTIEAPMTVNFPVFHSSRTSKISQPSILMDQSSIMFPVTVPRQTLPTVSSTDALETKVTIGGTAASKRKRKAWSEEEDNLLRDAVQKWGEGNWATMAKGDSFPIKRSATQLSQRWSALRKKDGSANPGSTVTTVTTNTQYTAEQLATRHSLNLALDMPFKKLTAPGVTDPGRTSTSIKNQAQPRNTVQVSTIHSSVPPQRPSQQACGSPTKPKLASENLVSKCNAMSARESKPAIVHSGAQTQTVSRTNAAPKLMVSQAKNVVHTVPAGSTLTKTPISAGLHQKIRSNVPAGSSLTKTPISTGLAPVQPNVNMPDSRSLSRTPISTGLPSNQKVHSNVHVGSSLTKTPISAGLPSNQKVYSNVPAASSLTKTPNSASLPSDPKVHSNVAAGSSLTKTPISAGLPSNQKVHSNVLTGSSLTKPPISVGLPYDPKVHSNVSTGSSLTKTPVSAGLPSTQKVHSNAPTGNSLTKTPISSGLPSNQKFHLNVSPGNSLTKTPVTAGLPSNQKAHPNVPASSSLTKTPISVGLPSNQKAHSNVPAGSSLTKTPISVGLPSDQKVHLNVHIASSLTKTPISASLPSNQKVHSNVPVGSSLTKTPISSGLSSDKKVHSNVPVASSLTMTPIYAGLPSDPKVHSNVPAGNSLTKTPISAGLPSDPKVHSNVPAGNSLTKTPISAGLPSDPKVHSNVPAGRSLSKTPISAGLPSDPKVHSNVPAGNSLTKTPISAVLPSDPKVHSNVPAGNSLTKTPISAGFPSDPKVHSNVLAGNTLTKTPISAGLPSDPKVHSYVPAGNSLTKAPISAGLPSESKVHSNVPAGNSLTTTPISVGLPSDQKDKHVTSVKEEEKRLTEPGSTPKENVKEEEASTSATEGQVNSKLDKARLDLDKAKSMPSEKVLEHKAVPQNPVGCEERGGVTNSKFTPNKATENGNDNLNKESQNLNPDKTSSVNENSQHQNMKEKLVNLPKQDECRQGLEVP